MKYHILGRFWIGVGIGSVIGNVIMLIISFAEGSGEFYAVMPHFVPMFPNEAVAALVQVLLYCLIGAVFAEAGIIFTLEKWNFPIKCLLHFGVTAIFFVPFLWICYFRHDALWRVLLIPLNLAATYVISWLTSYFSARADAKSINQKIMEMRRSGDDGNSNGGAV